MNKHTIEITKTDIADAVYRLTATAEQQRSDNIMVATPDNKNLIHSFISDSISALNDAVEFYGYANTDANNVFIKINTPSNWGGNIDTVKETARIICENFAMARWFELNGTADQFNSAVIAAITKLKRILDTRKKPL